MFSRLHPRSSVRSRRAATGLAATAGLVAGLAAALIAPTAASAAPRGPHDPFGSLNVKKAVAGGVVVGGWALDPDALASNVRVFAVVDGATRVVTTTSQAYRSASAKYKAGPTPGFTMTVPVASGKHTLCVGVINVGAGKNTLVTCMPTPLGTTLTSSQTAAHSPTGTVSRASASRTSLHLSGFTTDKDFINNPLQVVLYVDGRSAATVSTTASAKGAPTGSGRTASFDITEPVTTGTHMACLWVVNIGLGHNTFLGCDALDTRAGQAIAKGSPSTAINAKVLAEAKKHIGQPYVWGAIGPKKFDCSGLVMYSYKKQGFVTPRVSEDQAKAARLIPASRAIPGDLVFYHDTQGDVYHVGIYQGPLQTVAAIDEAEGVNYQHIWDPSTATYGSFTHV